MYKIYNCLGEQVGNPRGYRTIRGAERMLSRRVRGSLYNVLVDAYNKAIEGGNCPRFIFSIRWED